jgi:hypothetical protein
MFLEESKSYVLPWEAIKYKERRRDLKYNEVGRPARIKSSWEVSKAPKNPT